MSLVFAFLAGLLTLINPCVLPVLPIVLASALQAHRLGPVALALGMAVSFTSFGVAVAAFGQSIGLSERLLTQTAALLMVLFGATLLVPRLNAGFATVTAGFAARADQTIDGFDRSGLTGQALTGALLGAVWSPCVGPTLGGAISLAWQGQSLTWAAAIMASFALGVSVVMLTLAYGTRAALQRRRASLQTFANRAKPLMGVTLVAIGLILFFQLQQHFEAWAISVLPFWLQDLSVTF